MATFTLHRRDLVLSKAMRAALEASVTTVGQVVPGQLRQRGDWYFLTYLKVQKVKNFDPASFELETRDIDSVRAVAFKLSKEGKLLVQGGRAGIREIQEYLNALTLQVAGAAKEQTIQQEQYYKLREVAIDLAQLAARFEAKGVLEQVKGLRIKGLEVKYGKVTKCTVNVFDHAEAMKLLGEPLTMAGVESARFALRSHEKTSVEIGIDGAVTVRAGGAADDVDLETMTERLALAVDGRAAPAVAGEVPDAVLRAARDFCPKEGSGIDSIELRVPGERPVVITPETRKRLNKELDRRKTVGEFAGRKKARKRASAKAAG